MIGSFEKSKNKKGRSLKTKAQKTEIQRETQESYNWSINSTDQNVPRDHDACGATTVHFIRSETPRVIDNS